MGNWTVLNWRGQSTIIQNEKGQAIADCDVNQHLDMATKEANAKLMASAPEMLSVLQAVAHKIDSGISPLPSDDFWHPLRQIIAKCKE